MLTYNPSRLFVAPVEPEEAAKNADKIAAHPRSSIRRQRAVRRPNHQLRPEERSIRSPFEGSSTPLIPDHIPDFTDIVSPTEEAELEAIRARVAAGRRLRDLSRGDAHRISRVSRDRPSSPPQQRADAPLVTQASTSSTAPLMPPVPESRDFQGSRRPILYARRGRGVPWADYRRNSHNYQMEPHSTLFRRETASDLATNGPGPQLPALTPNFSPARRYTLEESRDRPRSYSPPSFASYPSYSAVSTTFPDCITDSLNFHFHPSLVSRPFFYLTITDFSPRIRSSCHHCQEFAHRLANYMSYGH
jgi:hypothetical protein